MRLRELWSDEVLELDAWPLKDASRTTPTDWMASASFGPLVLPQAQSQTTTTTIEPTSAAVRLLGWLGPGY
jgi:hypothetical protein